MSKHTGELHNPDYLGARTGQKGYGTDDKRGKRMVTGADGKKENAR